MSLKNWILLLLIYILYLCLGGLIFNTLECPKFQESRDEDVQKQENISRSLTDLKVGLSPDQVNHLDLILLAFTDGEENGNVTDPEDCEKWDFYNSLFFSFTAVTTIGYGHQAPETNYGRLVCVFYSLVGIPLNAILIGALGSLFSNKIIALKDRVQIADGTGLKGMGKVGRIVLEGILLFLIFTSIFLFLPAALFTYGGLEDKSWEYIDSLYYSFITLSTIGFGDMVAGRNSDEINPVTKMLYQVTIITWIIFGMGFIVGIINVLVEALQFSGKPVKRAILGLKNQILVQDYWRKILNEIIILKHGEGVWVDEELMEGAGGGSEPCLGVVDMSSGDWSATRSVSTGDMEANLTQDGDKMVLGQSLQSLTPGNDLSDIQELNEDTISSLRNFLTTANVGAGGDAKLAEWMENNFPGRNSLTETRPVTRKNSTHSQYSNTVIPRQDRGRGRRRSLNIPRKLSRRHSTTSNQSGVSHRSTVSTGGPVEQLLEQTTLGEFLTAVENVRAKSEAELMLSVDVEEGERSRKNSIFRKLSAISTRSIGREQQDNKDQGPLTLQQVTSLLAFQKYTEEASESTSEKSSTGHLMVPSKKNSTVGLNNYI